MLSRAEPWANAARQCVAISCWCKSFDPHKHSKNDGEKVEEIEQLFRSRKKTLSFY